MRASFFIGTISALTAQAILALELDTTSALMTTPDSHVVDALSLAEVDNSAHFIHPDPRESYAYFFLYL